MKRSKKFKLNRYDKKSTNQKWIDLVKIVVKTEADKQQILLTSEYIHGLRNIDTDIMGANLFAHLYQCPELIEVQSGVTTSGGCGAEMPADSRREAIDK